MHGYFVLPDRYPVLVLDTAYLLYAYLNIFTQFAYAHLEVGRYYVSSMSDNTTHRYGGHVSFSDFVSIDGDLISSFFSLV